MNNCLYQTTLALACLIFVSEHVVAKQLSANEIMHRANQASYYAGQDGRAKAEMTITDHKGRVRQRQMIMLRKDIAETDVLENNAYLSEQKLYIYFTRPADINKTGFLVWKNVASNDERWLYLPSLDLVRRIAASDKRTSFVGSDFFYEDISGRNINDDHHELIETTDNYYVVKNTPHDPSLVEFQFYKTYIHKETFIQVQIEYYDQNNELYRLGKSLKVDTIQGYPTITEASMENLKTGSSTMMKYSDVQYNIDLTNGIFSERYLRNPPQKFLY